MSDQLEPTGTVILKPGRDRSVLRRHPWVFSGAVATIEGEPYDGDLVRVVDSKGSRCLGVGHCQQRGSISVRMLAFEDMPIDADFWARRLGEAYAMRQSLGLIGEETNAYRLIHGEGDMLPGLIIDIYATSAVIEIHSTGMAGAVELIADALMAGAAGAIETVYAAGVGDAGSERIRGEGSEEVTISEHGHRFHVDMVKGQKTGFFLDQRENRQLLASYAPGKRVLNSYCYTGGFSADALKAGAAAVVSVDSSKPAMAMVERNLALNELDMARHEGVASDVQDYLRQHKGVYDLIVLDPPAFAKHKSARHQAIQAYHRINALALKQLAPGGLLFTFSCSQVVDAALFRGAILAAAIDARRHVRILHQLHQPADHPVSMFHPEGEYLKGFVLQVGEGS
jgi:23S rRNA (cytosine1962-C5)-methyltransferase